MINILVYDCDHTSIVGNPHIGHSVFLFMEVMG